MSMNFGRTLLGFKPNEVINEIQRIDSEHQKKVASLQAEIEIVRVELEKSEENAVELHKQLNYYMEREHMIAGVMLTAQRNSLRIEEEAREKARMMLEESGEELKKKLEELELLRTKVEHFKREFREVLEKYKYSLETMKVPSGESSFTPTLIINEKHKVQTINEFSS